MGAYASNFRNDTAGLVGEITHPSKEDWITAHATATGLTLVEVERLWQRFQQLGCSENGTLSSEVLNRPPASEDLFVKNILGYMISSDQVITFQGFLSAMKWAESNTLETKIKATFHLLNNGQDLTRDVLRKVLSRVYPEDSQEAVVRIADVFFHQMDTTNQGFISEDNFVNWVRNLPAETISGILKFHILPTDVNAAAQSDSPAYETRTPSVDTLAHQTPTDPVLQNIADYIAPRDWQLVANKLGFTLEDIDKFEKQHPKNPARQVMEILKAWRTRDGSQAHVETLEKVLRDSKMDDVALKSLKTE